MQQQDAQELMQFLLDDLHEDVNRIRKKPYLEDPEPRGRFVGRDCLCGPERVVAGPLSNFPACWLSFFFCILFVGLKLNSPVVELADEAWENHRRRNDSHVADLFQVNTSLTSVSL